MAFILKLFIRAIQILLYIILQIVFIPFLIIGLLVGLYKEMVVSKKMNISFSAGQALQYRWMMHYFETREDKDTVEFVKHFPCESHFGLWTTMGPLILANRWFAFNTKLNKLPIRGYEAIDSTAGARVALFDEIMLKHLDKVDQIVLPGAGFDLITNRYGRDKLVYEIDQVDTLNLKVKTLKKAKIDHEWITYIPVDYDRESWKEKLLESGFDASKKTLFIWQSVSLYLNESLIKESLKDMASLCSEGSVVVQDIYSKRFVSGEMSSIVKRNANLITKMGEPWVFGLDILNNPKEVVESFLESCDLQLTDYIQFGDQTGIEPYYCIVEATVK